VQAFHCPTCRRLVFFHNFGCLSCGAGLGYDPVTRSIVAFAGGAAEPWRSCGNRVVADCNWLVAASDPNDLCRSCRLTAVRPNDAEAEHLAAFADAESAKRQVLDQLAGLGLPIGASGGGPPQLRFRLMASSYERVVTGYEEGTITLDLSESNDAHRERVRQQLGELYRTVLGHLRHEIGHFYWWLLIAPSPHLERFRELFGDERADYQAALDQHYAQTADRPIALGAPGPWSDRHISVYATAHPWEDWAETFGQYLLIRDGLETAGAFGLEVGDPSQAAGRRPTPTVSDSRTGHRRFRDMIDRWLGYTFALNAMARSIGQGDLYPFVLSETVVQKLTFVHEIIEGPTGEVLGPGSARLR